MARQPSAGGAPPRTVDVVPAPASDPRGAAVLPLVPGRTAAGGAVNLLGLHGVRAVGALVGAALVGRAATGTAHSRPGVLTGDRWPQGATLDLATLAVTGAVAGLAALLGIAGAGIAAGVMMLLGNPLSGAASAPRMAPEPDATIVRWPPPSAGGDAAALGVLLRRRRGGRPRPHVDPAGGAGSGRGARRRPTQGPREERRACRRGGAPPSPSDRPPAGPSGEPCPRCSTAIPKHGRPRGADAPSRSAETGLSHLPRGPVDEPAERVESLQARDGDAGDEGPAVTRHGDALTAVHHLVDQVGDSGRPRRGAAAVTWRRSAWAGPERAPRSRPGARARRSARRACPRPPRDR